MVTHKVLTLHKTEDQEEVLLELETLEDSLHPKEIIHLLQAVVAELEALRQELLAETELYQILKVLVQLTLEAAEVVQLVQMVDQEAAVDLFTVVTQQLMVQMV